MAFFSEMVFPLILFLVSNVICKSIEIGNGTVLNIEEMNLIQPDNSHKIFNVSNIEQEVNIESNEIQGIYLL